MSFSQAIREAMREEMAKNQDVVVIGEDVGAMGGPFGLTKGFLEEFGAARVIEMPISESGFTGMAVGMAIRGMRPIAELMYNDFIGVCMDQLLNQASKLRYMTDGQVSVPMVLRAPMGCGRRNAGQHSQCLESIFTHIPGLKVVAPATAHEAKGLMRAAILDDDPVVFLEHKLLYAVKGEVTEDSCEIPLGKAALKRTGKDAVIVTWSRQVEFALQAAELLEKEGIDVEVLDLRTLVPLDWSAIRASVEKTHHVVVVEEGIKRSGYGAEISAQIMEALFDDLDGPVERVASLNIVAPFSGVLEEAYYPHPEDIVQGVKRSLDLV